MIRVGFEPTNTLIKSQGLWTAQAPDQRHTRYVALSQLTEGLSHRVRVDVPKADSCACQARSRLSRESNPATLGLEGPAVLPVREALGPAVANVGTIRHL